jgi:hypothetical protein
MAIKKIIKKTTVAKLVTRKPIAKKPIAKKPLRKAQFGYATSSDTVPASKDVNTYAGPLTERDTKALNERYPSTVGKKATMSEKQGYDKVAGKKTVISPKSVERYYRNNDENYLRSSAPDVQSWNAHPNADRELYPTTNNPEFKKGGTKKNNVMKKMKTGGMVNANAKVTASKVAGSKGVKSGVNLKASAQKVAKGRVGGTSKAPKTAVPR